MKVVVLAIVIEGNKVSGWSRALEMPVSPVGLNTLSAELGDTGILLNVETVGWSEHQSAFVVGTKALIDDPRAKDFRADDRWQPAEVTTGTKE